MQTTDRRTGALLVAAGFNLILLQLLVIRELAITLHCTELMILAVTVAHFAGYSLGYFLSPWIGPRIARRWLFATTLLHLPLIPAVRMLCGRLAEAGLEAWSLPIVGLAALTLTSLYTVFLPRAVARGGGSRRSLAACYSLELAGSAIGLLCALLVAGWWWEGMSVVYQLVLVGIGVCLMFPPLSILGLSGCAALVLAVMPSLDVASREYFYARFDGGIRDPRIVHTQYSLYQKIEVLDTARGRTLYLNGFELFNPRELERFNFFLSGVPARLKPGADVLVVGSGSMSSLRHLSPFAKRITTVEIDAAVVETGKRFFRTFNELDAVRGRWQLVIDDAKHYLSNTERRFDLVIIDVPAPYHVQTGLLFTREFYELVRSRLSAGGLMSIYLTEDFPADRAKRMSSQIMAAVASVYRDFYVIDTDVYPNGFAIAGQRLGFDASDIGRVIAEARPEASFAVYDRAEVLAVISGTQPASYGNLDIVWDLNLYLLPYALPGR